jgi:hypothetical protein
MTSELVRCGVACGTVMGMALLSHAPRSLAFALPALGAATVLVGVALTVDGGLSSLGIGWFGWLMSPYLALAVLLAFARRSGSRAFWISAVIGAAAVLGQTLLLTTISLTSEQDLAAVGVLGDPAACLPVIIITTATGLVFRHRERIGAQHHQEAATVNERVSPDHAGRP